ncbi:MAG: hypothetical protein AB7O62_24480 [Pirellulales bacterium]
MKNNTRLHDRSTARFSSPRLSQRRAAEVRSSWTRQEQVLRAQLAVEMQRRLLDVVAESRQGVA